MDIVIKSFNRVYYLDRCLYSILKYVENFRGNIYILDDGTPEVYLNKLKLKYPKIIVLKSPQYLQKSNSLINKNYDFHGESPSKFWTRSITNVSEYFVLLEDDMWFIKKIDLEQSLHLCREEGLVLLKFFWVSNPKTVDARILKIKKNIEVYRPLLKFSSPFIYRYTYMKYNTIWRLLLRALNIYSKEEELSYYSIYSVAGAIFKKDYYLSIWNGYEGVVDEKNQILKALEYKKKVNPNYAKVRDEVVKTGFVSSASTKYYYPDFSIHDFNCTLNEYWFSEETYFNSDLEFDLDENEIKRILKSENKSDVYISQWYDWFIRFRGQFRAIGSNI